MGLRGRRSSTDDAYRALCAFRIRSEKRFFSQHFRDRRCGVAVLDDAEPWRRACIEQRRSGERIGMIADVSGICALNHPDAGVMVDRYNPHRDACKQLAHNVAVPQGINRDFFQASLFSYSGERSGMIGPLPGLAVA